MIKLAMALGCALALAGCMTEAAKFQGPNGQIAKCGPYVQGYEDTAGMMQTCTGSFERQGYVRLP